MPITFRQVATLTDADRKQLFEWGDDIFEANHFNLRWRPKEVHFILDVDDIPVSHVGLVQHEVNVSRQPVLVGGVGGVVTVPAWQKHGFARELMKQAVGHLEQWRVDAGILFCLPSRVAFYESQGWQLLAEQVLIQQPQGEMASPLEVMVLPMRGYHWPVGEVKLNSFPW